MADNTDLRGNTEIEEAVKAFEQSNLAQEQKKIPQNEYLSEIPSTVKFVIRYSGGVIKDQKQAEYTLLGLVVTMIIVSVIIFLSGGEKASKRSFDIRKIDQLQFIR